MYDKWGNICEAFLTFLENNVVVVPLMYLQQGDKVWLEAEIYFD